MRAAGGAISYETLFPQVFGITFLLTMLLAPVVMFRSPGGILLWPVALLFGAGAIFYAAVIAMVAFVPLFRMSKLILPTPIAFVLVCLVTAFLNAWVGLALNIDLSPLAVRLDPAFFELGAYIGMLAAILAFFTSVFFVGSLR